MAWGGAWRVGWRWERGRVAGMSSLSNMPIKEASVPIGDTGYVWDVYEDSVKMSTYLLAFCVGEFDYVQKFTKDRVAVRVITPPGKREVNTLTPKRIPNASPYA